MTSRRTAKPITETLYQAEAHGPGMLCTTWSYNRGHGVTRATVGPLVREWMARDIGHGGRLRRGLSILANLRWTPAVRVLR